MPRGSQRQGMIVTSTGIVFSTARDGVLYAFDAETARCSGRPSCRWAPKGCRRCTSVNGKTYIVVNATTPRTWGLNSRESGIGSPEPLGKGGYVVISLP